MKTHDPVNKVTIRDEFGHPIVGATVEMVVTTHYIMMTDRNGEFLLP